MYEQNNVELFQVTDILTGVSGITPYSTAMSITRDGNRLFYNHYTQNSYKIYGYTPDKEQMERVDPADVDQAAAMLPTYTRRSRQIGQENLHGLYNYARISPTEFGREKYKSNSKPDYIASGDGVGVGIRDFIRSAEHTCEVESR